MISRKEWGARAPRNQTTIGSILGWALHHEGPYTGTYSHSECTARVRSVQNYHMDVENWADIAYNFLVCQHGQVFEGRGYGIRSAANGTNDSNSHYYAVCFLGGVNSAGIEDTFTDSAKSAISQLIGSAILRPHSDFFATFCPGNSRRAWIKERAASAIQSPTPIFGPPKDFSNVNLKRQELTTLPLDADGNGFMDTHIPYDELVSILPKGPSPDRDGGYDSSQWPDFRWSYNNTNNQARIVIENGTAHQPVSFITWRTA